MKPYFLAILFSLLTILSYPQIDNYDLFPSSDNPSKDIIPIYDSIYIYECNSWNNDWVLDQKIKDFIYQDNQIISQTTYTEGWDVWDPYHLENRTYSANHDPDSIITYIWDWGSWDVHELTLENYSNHKLIDQTKMDGHNGQWFPPDTKVIQTWDSDGHLLSRTEKGMHSGVLSNEYRYLYTYSAGKKMLEQHDGWLENNWLPINRTSYSYDHLGRYDIVYYETYIVSLWNKNRKSIYKYDSESKLDSVLVQISTEGIWTDHSKVAFFYDGQNRFIKYIQIDWDGSQWVNSHKQEKGYDEYGYENYISEAFWLDTAWLSYKVVSKTFDPDKLIVSQSTLNFDQFGGRWGDSTQYYFKKVVGLEETAEKDINIYPNPGNGIYAIDTKEQITEIEIYNTTGLIVGHLSSPNRIINLNNLPEGMYLLKINIKGNVVVKKVIIHHS